MELRAYLRRWVNAGCERAGSLRERRQTRTSNILALAFSVLSLPYLGITWAMNAPFLSALILIGVALYLLTPAFNRWGYSRTARALPLVVASLSTWLVGAVLTPASEVQLCLFMVGLWAFVLFDARKEWQFLVGLESLPALVYFSVDLNLTPKIISFEPTPGLLAGYATTLPIVTFILQGAFLFTFNYRNQRNEDRLLALVGSLEQAHRNASAAEHSKSEFLAMMTHEIRTPLNGVLGSAELLKSQPLSTEQAQWLRTLSQSAEYLLDLMTSILEYANVDRCGVELHETAVDVGLLLEETLEVLAPGAEAKGLEFWYRESPELPRTLLIDPGRFRVVARALLDNAVKYTDSGHVEVLLDYYAHESGNGQIVLRVIDTGIGLAPAVQDKVFGAFWQAESFEHRSHSGVGIGLPLAKATVEAMHGSLQLESSPEIGSCFTAKLPVSMPPVELGSVEPTDLSLKTVRLVIESEPFAHALRAMLTAWGHSVVGDDDPRGADVLLLDSKCASLAEAHGQGPRGSEQIVMLGRSERSSLTSVVGLERFLRKADWFETLRHLFGESTARIRQANRGSLLPKAESDVGNDDAGPMVQRIVIADDQLTNRTILKKIAERFATQVILVENGKLAVEAWEKYQPEVILMDIQMPVMDGIEATRAIRNLETPQNRPAIIAVTANALSNQRAKGFLAGLDEYLTKPIRLSELSSAIARLCATSTLPQSKAPQAPQAAPQGRIEDG